MSENFIENFNANSHERQANTYQMLEEMLKTDEGCEKMATSINQHYKRYHSYIEPPCHLQEQAFKQQKQCQSTSPSCHKNTSPVPSSTGSSSSTSSNDEHSQTTHSQKKIHELLLASSLAQAKTLDDNDVAASNALVSKYPRSTFPFGKCKVCNDEASGVHYGVATCEGCKGFFKRCILRKEKYRCFFGSTCPVMPDNRNKCKACRFKRCLEAGMSMDGIKMGRIPKSERQRAIINEEMKNRNENSNSTALGHNDCVLIGDSEVPSNTGKMSSSHSITSTVCRGTAEGSAFAVLPSSKRPSFTTPFVPSQAQIEYLQELTSNKTNSNMLISKRLNKNYNVLSVVETSRHLYESANTNTKVLLMRAHNLIKFGIKQFIGHNASLNDVWDGLICDITVKVKQMIGYAKELPGFGDASPQDFGSVIRHRLFEFSFLQTVKLIIGDEVYWMLPNEIQYSRTWMSKISGKEISDVIMDFGNDLNGIAMTENELALLMPFVLTIHRFCFKGYNDFSGSEYLRSLHDMYSHAFMYEVKLNKRDMVFMEKLKKILDFFPKFNHLTTIFRQLTPLCKSCTSPVSQHS